MTTPGSAGGRGRGANRLAYALVCSAVLLLAGCGAPGALAGAAAATPAASERQPPAASPTPNPLLAQARAIANPAAAPVRLQVPSIGVDAAIEQVGLDAQGRMGTPSKAVDVAWYELGSAPGDAGNAVIDGHLDWTTGPAVFWSLGRVHVGDAITVARADGTRVRFVADATSVMAYTASTSSMFTSTGPPSLTLITCAGAWDTARGTYLQRLVVHAALAPGAAIESPVGAGG